MSNNSLNDKNVNNNQIRNNDRHNKDRDVNKNQKANRNSINQIKKQPMKREIGNSMKNQPIEQQKISTIRKHQVSTIGNTMQNKQMGQQRSNAMQNQQMRQQMDNAMQNHQMNNAMQNQQMRQQMDNAMQNHQMNNVMQNQQMGQQMGNATQNQNMDQQMGNSAQNQMMRQQLGIALMRQQLENAMKSQTEEKEMTNQNQTQPENQKISDLKQNLSTDKVHELTETITFNQNNLNTKNEKILSNGVKITPINKIEMEDLKSDIKEEGKSYIPRDFDSSLMELLIQNERNGGIFYEHLLMVAPHKFHQEILEQLQKGSVKRSNLYTDIYKKINNKTFVPSNEEIEKNLNYKESIQVAIQEESHCLKSLNDLYKNLEDEKHSKALNCAINDKIIDLSMLHLLNSVSN